jgi:hypothetical protein
MEHRNPILIVAVSTLVSFACGGDSGSPTGPGGYDTTGRPLNQRIDTADITFYFAEGDWVDTRYQQAFHEWAVRYLGISMPQRLRYFKYFDNDHMREINGQPYGSWADVENYAIHSVERRQGHEAIHCYSRVIGWPSDFFTEGIAVALDINPYTGEEVEFFGAPVHTLCRGWLAEGSLYPLRDIVENGGFWSRRWTQTYPQAGSFTQFLIQELGLGTWKELFRAIDDYDSTETILGAFTSVFGMSLEEAEGRWHEFLRESQPQDTLSVSQRKLGLRRSTILISFSRRIGVEEKREVG